MNQANNGAKYARSFVNSVLLSVINECLSILS